MRKALFGENEYTLANNVVDCLELSLTMTIEVGNKKFDDVVNDVQAEVIKIYEEDGLKLVAEYIGYSKLTRAELLKDYVVHINPDTGEVNLSDAMNVELRKATNAEQRINDLEDTVDILAETILG